MMHVHKVHKQLSIYWKPYRRIIELDHVKLCNYILRRDAPPLPRPLQKKI